MNYGATTLYRVLIVSPMSPQCVLILLGDGLSFHIHGQPLHRFILMYIYPQITQC